MKKNLDGIFIIGIFLINIIIRLPFLNLPANYDETNYLGGVMAIVENKLNPITYFWGYKPPAMFEPVAIAWRVFGESLGWARVLIYFLSSIVLVYTFLLGKLLFGRRVGVCSVLLLFCFPLFMTQSLVYQDAVPLTAFFVMTLYYFFKKDYLWYLISASLLVMTKEITIFIPAFLFTFECIQNKYNFKKAVVSLKYFVPLIFFVIWMCLNKLWLGWYLWPFNVEIMDYSRFLKIDFDYYFHSVFFEDKVCLYLSLILSGWLVVNKEAKLKKHKNKSVVGLFIFMFFFYFLFCFLVSSLTRYILFTYVLLFILTANYLFVLFEKKVASWIFMGVLLVSILSNVFVLFFREDFSNGDKDLRLFSNVILNKKTVDYVKMTYNNPVFITVWPISNFLDTPVFGYLENGYEDVETIECYKTVDIDFYKRKYPGRELVVVSPLNICSGRDIGANTTLKLKTTLEIEALGQKHQPVYIYE